MAKSPKLWTPYEAGDWETSEHFASRYMSEQAALRGVSFEEITGDEIKLALAEQVLNSPMFAIRNFFHTVSKTKEVITIDPFLGQIVLDIACESQRRYGSPERIIEIKPRQVGWTTWLLGRTTWRVIQPNNTAVIMVPDDEVAKSVNKRLGDIYNNLGWMTPMRRIDNQRQIVLSNPDSRTRDLERGLESQIIVTVPGPLRGLTPQTLVLSEYAHIRDTSNIDPSDMLDGVLSGMSAGPESAVYIDTTPNGYDDDYYPMVVEAVERNPKWVAAWERHPPTREEVIAGIMGQPDNPDEGWLPVFFSWLWHEEYRTKDENPIGQRRALTPKQRQHIEATLGKEERYGNDEEIELVQRYGASIGNIAWRRFKLDTDIQGFDYRQKLLTFRQEYATTWDSCFVDYGNSAFDALGLEAVSRQAKPPSAMGKLEKTTENGVLVWNVVHNPYQWDEMRFWAPPGNDKFVIGVDLGWAFESTEVDQTFACVLRRRDLKQVAVYESRAPMHRVRDMLYALYKFYNNAYTAIETKGPGKNLVHDLWQMGLTNQYRWKRLDVEMPEDTKFLGWETSYHTRPQMEGIIVEEISRRAEGGRPQPGIILRDKKTIDQLKALKRYPDDGGKMKTRGGKDDASDALMIALAANRDPLHAYTPPRPKTQKTNDYDSAFPSAQPFMVSLSQAGRTRSRNSPDYRDL